MTAHTRAVTRGDPPGDAVVDVQRTRKALIHVAEHRHRIKFSVLVDLPSYWIVKVFVDSRDDERRDVTLFASKVVGDPQCGARDHSGRVPMQCDPALNDPSKFWWSLRRGHLHPNKAIRWRIMTVDPGGIEEPPDDLAPDVGWYP